MKRDIAEKGAGKYCMTGDPNFEAASTPAASQSPERADAQDAADYAAGRITLDEYNARVLPRYLASEEANLGNSVDPVVVYDVMCDTETSLRASYVWLARHATDDTQATKWRDAGVAASHQRKRVDARDMAAQRRITAEFRARERALRSLVLV